MKKITIILVLVFLAASCLCLVACTEKPEIEVFTVNFFVDDVCVDSINVYKGEVIGTNFVLDEANEKPRGYYSWYTTRTGTIEWNLYKDTVECNMNLYARVNSL